MKKLGLKPKVKRGRLVWPGEARCGDHRRGQHPAETILCGDAFCLEVSLGGWVLKPMKVVPTAQPFPLLRRNGLRKLGLEPKVKGRLGLPGLLEPMEVELTAQLFPLLERNGVQELV